MRIVRPLGRLALLVAVSLVGCANGGGGATTSGAGDGMSVDGSWDCVWSSSGDEGVEKVDLVAGGSQLSGTGVGRNNGRYRYTDRWSGTREGNKLLLMTKSRKESLWVDFELKAGGTMLASPCGDYIKGQKRKAQGESTCTRIDK
jgi:hypothetical protein